MLCDGMESELIWRETVPRARLSQCVRHTDARLCYEAIEQSITLRQSECARDHDSPPLDVGK